jgi:hypothetical protein
MSNISIDKNLIPGEEIEFRVEMNIFGEEVEDYFKFVVPNAPPLVNKVRKVSLKIENKDEFRSGDNKTFNFNQYVKKASISKDRYELLIVLTANKVPGSLSAGDDIIINCSEAGLNNVTGVVLPGDSKKKNYLFVSINKTNQPSSNKDLSTSGTVQEYNKRIRNRKVTVELPEGFNKRLVSEVSAPAPKKGNVEDIVIFAYKQFNGRNKASIKYNLMNSGEDDIDLKVPPARSKVLDFIRKVSNSKTFTINDEKGQKLLFYIAIARYTYSGEGWKGEWLQVDDSKNVIWGRVD